jgi:hypothetical protein
MTGIDELKRYAHHLIDEIDDEDMMRQAFETVRDLVQSGNGWDDLSPEDKAGIERALVESKDPNNWIPHEVVKERFAKWLTR